MLDVCVFFGRVWGPTNIWRKLASRFGGRWYLPSTPLRELDWPNVAFFLYVAYIEMDGCVLRRQSSMKVLEWSVVLHDRHYVLHL